MRQTKLSSSAVLFSAGITLLFSACKNNEIFENDVPQDMFFEEGHHFDFSTVRSVLLDICYGSGIGANSLVQIYGQYPSENTEVEPLYQISTDENGCISCSIELPSYISEVWLVNHRFGMPEYEQCQIIEDQITYEYTAGGSASRTRSILADIDDSDYSSYVSVIDNSRKIYSIVSWDDRFGNIQNHPLVCKDLDLSGSNYSTYVANLEKSLWNGNSYKPSGLDNSKFALGSDIVNTKVLYEFVKENNEIATVASASLNLVFMSEGAWNQNVVGYYYYPTSQQPASSASIKKFVCLPNASKPAHYPYGGNASASYQSNQAPAYAGESVSLLFENEDGTFTKNFPPGYTIGYFIISNGFVPSSSGKGTIDTGKTIIYSNEAWNTVKTNKGLKERFIALSLPNGAIVYGVEDSTGDSSYDDCLFIIQGTPNEAIKNDDIPCIDPEAQTIYYWDHKSRVYAFEDLWPDGGDYDLNDVVVSHQRNVEFDNTQNQVRTVIDEFTLSCRSASNRDGFAIQLNKNYLGTISITKGVGEDAEDITGRIKHYADDRNGGNETYILFEDLQQVQEGEVFTITRTFKSKVDKTGFEKAENVVNPFVIAKFSDSDYNSGNMVEIHIPNTGNRTSKGTNAGSTGDEYFYICRKGNHYYPFAISIPERSFNPSTENVCIDLTYPRFNQWVSSWGAECTDWYNHRTQ